jgi:regulator of protease activity HflC (stomatin/prohibitin superfamily)
MKKLIMLVVTLAMASFLTGCMTTIEPGHVGIKINKVGDNRGVSKENLVAGWVFYLPITTKIVEYPVFNQRVVWSVDKNEGKPTNEELTFQTKDNVPVSMDMSVNYTLLEAKVPEFYTKFRADDIAFFTHGFLRDQARNAVTQIGSEYSFDDINGVKKEEFLVKVNQYLIKSVSEYGVQISSNGVSMIGAMRVPENLRQAIGARVQSIQDAIKSENDLRKMKAEAAKAVAQAEGEAASMRAKSASITPQFMELKKLEIEAERVKKWDGKLPVTMLSGGNTLFNLK